MRLTRTRKLLRSRPAKHLTLVLVGNIAAAGMGFLSILIISRVLTVSAFGLFNLALSIMITLSSFSGMGTETSMVTFASFHLGNGRPGEAARVIRVSLYARAVFSLIIAMTVFLTARPLSTAIFHYPELVPLIELSAVGIFVISIAAFFKSVFFTYQLFKRSVVQQLLVDILKLVSVFCFLYLLRMETVTAFAIFALAPLLGIIYGFVMLKGRLTIKNEQVPGLYRRLFDFSKWLLISNLCILTLPYVGIFMLSNMDSSEAAGIYALALNLTYIFPIIIYSLHSVLLPEVSRFKEREQFEKYFKSSLKVSFLIAVAIVPILIFSSKIIPFFFGAKYVGSVPVFNLLLLGFFAVTVNSTLRVLLFSIEKPHVVTLVDSLKLFIMIILSYLFIPYLGVKAPAAAYLLVNALALASLSIYVFKKILAGGEIEFKQEETLGSGVD